jgi:hypothetical protein
LRRFEVASVGALPSLHECPDGREAPLIAGRRCGGSQVAAVADWESCGVSASPRAPLTEHDATLQLAKQIVADPDRVVGDELAWSGREVALARALVAQQKVVDAAWNFVSKAGGPLGDRAFRQLQATLAVVSPEEKP